MSRRAAVAFLVELIVAAAMSVRSASAVLNQSIPSGASHSVRLLSPSPSPRMENCPRSRAHRARHVTYDVRPHAGHLPPSLPNKIASRGHRPSPVPDPKPSLPQTLIILTLTLTRHWCIADSAPGTPHTMDSSNLGARHRRLGHDAASTTQQWR